jgi:hypothetical protein
MENLSMFIINLTQKMVGLEDADLGKQRLS